MVIRSYIKKVIISSFFKFYSCGSAELPSPAHPMMKSSPFLNLLLILLFAIRKRVSFFILFLFFCCFLPLYYPFVSKCIIKGATIFLISYKTSVFQLSYPLPRHLLPRPDARNQTSS